MEQFGTRIFRAMQLNGKSAVVTGASLGIGLAIARAFIDEGMTVYGFARNEDRLRDTAEQLGDAFRPITCDVGNPDQVADSVGRVSNEANRVDVLVNNAGVGLFGPVEDLTTEDWLRLMDTNVNGVFYCTRATVPIMKMQNRDTGFGGHIINIASVAGLVGNAQLSAYNLTKFGLRGFSDALMKELRPDGIRVTCVYPGSVETSFVDDGGSGQNWKLQPEDIASTVVQLVRLPDDHLVSEVVMRPLRPPRR